MCRSSTTVGRATLSASLATETSNINTLLAGVPTDTLAELQAARQAMFQDNRVFVVMEPQVHLTIAADTITRTPERSWRTARLSPRRRTAVKRTRDRPAAS